MERKKDVIYLSSKEALMKIFVLILTLGISVLASLYDEKSCYITVLVQACNNMYDFYPFTNNIRYVSIIKRSAITVILLSIIAIIVSIIALLGTYKIMQSIWIKVIAIFLVTVPLIVVYHDFKVNVEKVNGAEESS